MIIWKIDHRTITYQPIRNECRLILRKIITNRQKWPKITMVTRDRVYGPTNLRSPYTFPDLPDRGSWKETLLLGLPDPEGEGDLQLRSLSALPGETGLGHSLTKCPGCWQRKHKRGDPLSFETGLREKSLWRGLPLPCRRGGDLKFGEVLPLITDLVLRTSALISATLSCNTVNLLSMSTILLFTWLFIVEILLSMSVNFSPKVTNLPSNRTKSPRINLNCSVSSDKADLDGDDGEFG